MAKAFDPRKQKEYEINMANKQGDYYGTAEPMWFRETYYRSKLEASWAVWWRIQGIEAQYEPITVTLENGEIYTPDFFLPEHKIWVECKSHGAWNNLREEVERKIRGLTDIKKQRGIVVTSMPHYIANGEVVEFYSNNDPIAYNTSAGVVKLPAEIGNKGRHLSLFKMAYHYAKEQDILRKEWHEERENLKDDNSDRLQFIEDYLKEYNIDFEKFSYENNISKVKLFVERATYDSIGIDERKDLFDEVWDANDIVYRHKYTDWYDYDLETCIKLGAVMDPHEVDLPYYKEWSNPIEKCVEEAKKLCKSTNIYFDSLKMDKIKEYLKDIEENNKVPGTIFIGGYTHERFWRAQCLK